MRRTVALDKVEAEAVKADGPQQLQPLDDVLPHKFLRVVDVGRGHIIFPSLVVACAPKHGVVAADGRSIPGKPAAILVPPACLILQSAALSVQHRPTKGGVGLYTEAEALK